MNPSNCLQRVWGSKKRRRYPWIHSTPEILDVEDDAPEVFSLNKLLTFSKNWNGINGDDFLGKKKPVAHSLLGEMHLRSVNFQSLFPFGLLKNVTREFMPHCRKWQLFSATMLAISSTRLPCIPPWVIDSIRTHLSNRGFRLRKWRIEDAVLQDEGGQQGELGVFLHLEYLGR